MEIHRGGCRCKVNYSGLSCHTRSSSKGVPSTINNCERCIDSSCTHVPCIEHPDSIPLCTFKFRCIATLELIKLIHSHPASTRHVRMECWARTCRSTVKTSALREHYDQHWTRTWTEYAKAQRMRWLMSRARRIPWAGLSVRDRDDDSCFLLAKSFFFQIYELFI